MCTKFQVNSINNKDFMEGEGQIDPPPTIASRKKPNPCRGNFLVKCSEKQRNWPCFRQNNSKIHDFFQSEAQFMLSKRLVFGQF